MAIVMGLLAIQRMAVHGVAYMEALAMDPFGRDMLYRGYKP